MRNIVITLLFILSGTMLAHAGGVAIVDANAGSYFRMLSSEVNVSVENQIAVVTTREIFRNGFNSTAKIKYGFPMPEDGSATELKFYVNDQWYKATFSATPQDTSLPGPGGNIDNNLKEYLGDTPLYYNIEHQVDSGDSIIIQLSYVQLLPYEYGKVRFYFPNDYRYIQTYPLNEQNFNFFLTSERTINSVDLIDLSPDIVFNDGSDAQISFSTLETVANFNYNVEYELALDELGLYNMSTFLSDSIIPDPYGQGFFTFIVEPDPSENTEVINKVFTLIVDRSGSMSGDKIVQARNAANFIVENLNEGDYFNIVDFSSGISTFKFDHVEYTQETKQEAVNYINQFHANGSTNISGAFDVAIPQFSHSSDSTANIIIFFTDGRATAGITETNTLLEHVQQTIINNEVIVSIFTFGIGSDVNKQLLTLLASQNNGMAEFLGRDELEEKITQFYLTIRNPVLINTNLTFSPASMIKETYPINLPNLYKGQQLIISGRYAEAASIEVKLSGTAYGMDVEYNYTMNLSDSTIDKNRFLTKIWAKQKIEYLLVEYYSLQETDPQREAIKEDIIAVSISYGVLSPFTSLTGDEYTGIEESSISDNTEFQPTQFELLGNYPNPFNPSTKIRLKVNEALHNVLFIKIYNSLGELVRILQLPIDDAGIYEVTWDGLGSNGMALSSGNYFYVINFNNSVIAGKMTLMK